MLLLFYALVFWPQITWDLSFLMRDQTHTPSTGRQSLSHSTIREVLSPPKSTGSHCLMHFPFE